MEKLIYEKKEREVNVEVGKMDFFEARSLFSSFHSTSESFRVRRRTLQGGESKVTRPHFKLNLAEALLGSAQTQKKV